MRPFLAAPFLPGSSWLCSVLPLSLSSVRLVIDPGLLFTSCSYVFLSLMLACQFLQSRGSAFLSSDSPTVEGRAFAVSEPHPHRHLTCAGREWNLAQCTPTPGAAGGGGEPSAPLAVPEPGQQVLQVTPVELAGQPPPRKSVGASASSPCLCVCHCPVCPVLFPGTGAGCEQNHPSPKRMPC